MKRATAWADGGVRGTPGPHACAVVLKIDGEMPQKKSRYLGPAGTSNQAEIHGLLMALRLAAENEVTHLVIRMDSKLIVEQSLGNWKIKNVKLRRLHDSARQLALCYFQEVQIDQIPREQNTEADEICTTLLDSVTGRVRGSSGKHRATRDVPESSLSEC